MSTAYILKLNHCVEFKDPNYSKSSKIILTTSSLSELKHYVVENWDYLYNHDYELIIQDTSNVSLVVKSFANTDNKEIIFE